jgi:hypothetical protein
MRLPLEQEREGNQSNPEVSGYDENVAMARLTE